jgi:hypothetical protein
MRALNERTQNRMNQTNYMNFLDFSKFRGKSKYVSTKLGQSNNKNLDKENIGVQRKIKKRCKERA